MPIKKNKQTTQITYEKLKTLNAKLVCQPDCRQIFVERFLVFSYKRVLEKVSRILRLKESTKKSANTNFVHVVVHFTKRKYPQTLLVPPSCCYFCLSCSLVDRSKHEPMAHTTKVPRSHMDYWTGASG